MLIRKAYKFRLKPSAIQEEQLRRYCGCARFVWNKVWRMNHDRLERGQPLLWYQEADFWLKLWKQSDEYGFLREAPSHALQQKLRDLDKAWRDGFDKNQPHKRLPRSKRRGMDDSIRFPDPKQIRIDNRRIKLPKLGWVRFFKSREIKGTIKNATVSYRAGHWYVSVQVEQVLPDRLHPSRSDVGIDLGVAKFAALSNGITYDPVHALRKHEQRLTRAQRTLSRKVKFSQNWQRQKRKIQRLHHKIACCRSDFLHKTSTAISENQAVVFVEDLQVRNMSRSAAGTIDEPGRNVRAKAGLNKSILDQGWGEFVRQLDYKLRWRGGWLVKVPPQHTSQECSACGHTSPDNRKTQAIFHCRSCGHKENADTNAAKNIQARGHCVLACGGNGVARPVKQEPVGNREGVPPTASPEAVGIPVL